MIFWKKIAQIWKLKKIIIRENHDLYAWFK